MRVISAGLISIVAATAIFAILHIRMVRLEKELFDKTLVNINADVAAKDILEASVTGIEEDGTAVISEVKAGYEYNMLMRDRKFDNTGFFVITGKELEKYDEEQWERNIFAVTLGKFENAVNKKLKLSFLFTAEGTDRYNNIAPDSLYIMIFPEYANRLKLRDDKLIYTFSGAGVR